MASSKREWKSNNYCWRYISHSCLLTLNFFFITTRKTAIISEKKNENDEEIFFFFLLFYFPHTHTYAIFNGFFFLFFASPLFIPFSSNSKHIPFDDFVRTFHFSCFSPSIREIIFFPLLFFPFSPIQQHGTISFRFQMQNWHFTLYKNYISRALIIPWELYLHMIDHN